MRDAYIVTSLRTPGCKKGRGAFAYTRPEALISHVLNAVVEKTGIEKAAVEDLMIGCAFPEADQGLNIGRIVALKAGFPIETTGATVNRFCSSGLEAIAQSSLRVMAGWSDVVIAGGIESMTKVPMGGNIPRPEPELAAEQPDVYVSMGITAENVASRYNVTREDQDEYAFHSHMKAVEAQEKGYFSEIVPTPAAQFTHEGKTTKIQEIDDGVRKDTTLEKLARLNPAFAAGGTVTAGNSSQTTDGAAATLIMSEDAVKKYNVTPIAKFKCYTTMGVAPDEMGIGPSVAIPKLLNMAGLSVSDIGCFEVNEAFASQFLYCLRELGLGDRKYWASDSNERIVNINGGAIALGHPLGCTGAKLAATLTTNMKRLNAKYGVESMCVGGGMGAAALFELC